MLTFTKPGWQGWQQFIIYPSNQKPTAADKTIWDSICLLDATYKITRYAAPLFFAVRKTNAHYQVVAPFALLGETTAAISEDLSVLKSCNPF